MTNALAFCVESATWHASHQLNRLASVLDRTAATLRWVSCGMRAGL